MRRRDRSGNLSSRQAGRRPGVEQRHCVALNHSPLNAGCDSPAPADSSGLVIAGRRFQKSGPVWLGPTCSRATSSYLALFSTSARRGNGPTKSGSWRARLERWSPRATYFIDLYRVQDAQRWRPRRDLLRHAGHRACLLGDSRVLLVPGREATRRWSACWSDCDRDLRCPPDRRSRVVHATLLRPRPNLGAGRRCGRGSQRAGSTRCG